MADSDANIDLEVGEQATYVQEEEERLRESYNFIFGENGAIAYLSRAEKAMYGAQAELPEVAKTMIASDLAEAARKMQDAATKLKISTQDEESLANIASNAKAIKGSKLAAVEKVAIKHATGHVAKLTGLIQELDDTGRNIEDTIKNKDSQSLMQMRNSAAQANKSMAGIAKKISEYAGHINKLLVFLTNHNTEELNTAQKKTFWKKMVPSK